MADRSADRSWSSDKRSSMGSSCDDPPNSRLFIIGSKNLSEDDFRQAFEEFGTIEEIWVVKDRHTGDNKGVTYVKYSKTSEAAKAMEAMNGKSIGSMNRSIRVMIAANRDQGSKRDSNEEEKTQRLFVMVPKSMTDDDLYEAFKAYGDIDYATIVRDRETRENKGFAYVKYYKFSHAAAAFEQCDRKYKAVFAEPRKSNVSRHDDRYNSPVRSSMSSTPSSNFMGSGGGGGGGGSGYTKLIAIVNPQVNQDQLWKLFDIVPGLDYCHLRLEGRPHAVRGIASVVYTSAQSAAHAREKIHGFEYPPGNRIIVKPDPSDPGGSSSSRGGGSSGFDGSRSSSTDRAKTDILQIAETIAQASSLIQAAGLSQDILQTKLGLVNAAKESEMLCSVKLPDPQPFASIDQDTASRCFIVCTPSPPPPAILKDVFCRFGNLIDVYMLNNRNCGYAKYATKESAEQAINTLHGAEVYGIRMKVLEAEERGSGGNARKRQRVVDSPF